jgi:predicted metal-dependent hydrolase
MVKAKSFQLSTESGYRVRESARAKHVSIRVSHMGEVEIVVPPGFNRRRIPEILKLRQDWIDKTTQRMKTERTAFHPEAELLTSKEVLPEQIELRSLLETWQITYQSAEVTQTAEMMRTPEVLQIKARITAPYQLLVSGSLDQTEACQQVLQRWLSRKALIHFTPWLQQVSQELGLPYSKISVRGQRTRWASCSSQNNISLNYKLLFLPAPLVRYVFIHELCHTVHLNHSAQFWALVAEKEPRCRALDAELRRGWRYVPDWIERSSQ